uniref:hypothetical protein n=1 Tax=Thaumasiovibrio occultus TaxID=1891184 RepID=UPI000B350391|nr:hypothetical protein [Thaumasiovibrio occultus]
MHWLLIIIGAFLLLLTLWDYRNEETDTIWILDTWFWFDIRRESFPMLYWCILAIQAVSGLGLIGYGIIGL